MKKFVQIAAVTKRSYGTDLVVLYGLDEGGHVWKFEDAARGPRTWELLENDEEVGRLSPDPEASRSTPKPKPTAPTKSRTR